MGFRKGSYATVWSVESISNTMTKGRISIDRKNRNTDQYEQDFGGFVDFVGTAAAHKALSLKERDRIKLGDVDVTNRYDKEKKKEYTNYKVFDFDIETRDGSGSAPARETTRAASVYDGEPQDGGDDLPF